MLFLHNKYTGTKKMIGSKGQEDEWFWSPDSNEGWCLSGDYRWNSIEPLMRIYRKNTPSLIPKKFARMLEHFPAKKGANIFKLLGPTYSSSIKDRLVKDAHWLNQRSSDPYFSFYRETNEWLSTLQPAVLNMPRYNSIIHNGTDIKASVYQSEDTGLVYIRPPDYARDRSKTGRLSVVNGVRVLTMKAEYRNILRDAWQIDFEAMEPRFLLSLLGKTVNGDFYDWVANQCGFKIMTRNQVKVAVLSSMYGHKNQIREVTELLGLHVFEKALQEEVERGWIKNWFGRPIYAGEVRGRHLVSLWLQSTCADAALLGFKNFCVLNPSIVPHWTIHDALIYTADDSTISEIPTQSSIIIEWNDKKIAMPYKIGRVE